VFLTHRLAVANPACIRSNGSRDTGPINLNMPG
jgi:hypothetical protein